MIDLAELPERLAEVRERIAAACARSGRRPGDVTLIGVTKTHPAALVEAAWRAGLAIVGENRVQEALGKSRELSDLPPPPEGPEWHLIGPLQSNKVRVALDLFRAIHSIDRPKIAKAIAEEMTKQGKTLQLFVQVNTGEEPQKAGVTPGEADAFIALCRGLDLPVEGLMCIPPADLDPAPHFRLLAQIAARNGLSRLSMGMSDDFETAIACGATSVRVGSALFGSRT